MSAKILSRVNDQLEQFQSSHRGEKPLYILVSPYEADQLIDEVKQAAGYAKDTLVTEYNGSKIIKYEALKKGDMQLTDELPESSG